MPVKQDDFMPFGDNPEMGNYWVGYFSSRPNLKSLIKQLTHLNYQANKVFSLFLLRDNVPQKWQHRVIEARDVLLDAVGMSNHHDAITGTCGKPVAEDYAFRVHKALYETRKVVADITKFHLKEDTGIETPRLFACERSNGTFMDCPPGKLEDASAWLLTIFNPSL